MASHRRADPEFAREAREEREIPQPRSPAIEALEEQIAALDRITAKHPELADHNARRKERLETQIRAMEND